MKLTNPVFNIWARFETVIFLINSLFIHAKGLSKMLEISSHILWFFTGFKVIVQFNPIWSTSYFLRNPLFKTILVNIARRRLTGFLFRIHLYNPYCLHTRRSIIGSDCMTPCVILLYCSLGFLVEMFDKTQQYLGYLNSTNIFHGQSLGT